MAAFLPRPTSDAPQSGMTDYYAQRFMSYTFGNFGSRPDYIVGTEAARETLGRTKDIYLEGGDAHWGLLRGRPDRTPQQMANDIKAGVNIADYEMNGAGYLRKALLAFPGFDDFVGSSGVGTMYYQPDKDVFFGTSFPGLLAFLPIETFTSWTSPIFGAFISAGGTSNVNDLIFYCVYSSPYWGEDGVWVNYASTDIAYDTPNTDWGRNNWLVR